MNRPDKRSSCPSRLPTRERKAQLFDNPESSIGKKSHKARMFLIPASLFQSIHCPSIIFGAHVTLRAVLMRDIPQPHGHDEAGQSHTDGPVSVSAVPIVEV